MLRNFLSIDEMRISILVLSFFIAFLSVMYLFLTKQNVDSGLLDLTKTLIYSIAGVNGIQAISYGYSSYYSSRSSSNLLNSTSISSTTTSTNNINNETEMSIANKNTGATI